MATEMIEVRALVTVRASATGAPDAEKITRDDVQALVRAVLQAGSNRYLLPGSNLIVDKVLSVETKEHGS